MKLGNLKIFIIVFAMLNINTLPTFSVDKIESVPLINLEDLSPTFEEDKDKLEKIGNVFICSKAKTKIKILKFPSFIFFHIFS